MRTPSITVILAGSGNDKEVFQTAVRMAAREKATVRVILGDVLSLEMYQKHLDFVLWDLRERLRLTPPEITLEIRQNPSLLAGELAGKPLERTA